MAELRAVQKAFPLYGRVDLQGGQPYTHALVEGHGALVRPELLTSIGVSVGDQIAIGQATFTIRGLVTKEPGRGMGEFSLGPRVIIDYDDLSSTGLLGFGSRARRMILVKMPEERVESLGVWAEARQPGVVRRGLALAGGAARSGGRGLAASAGGRGRGGSAARRPPCPGGVATAAWGTAASDGSCARADARVAVRIP